jgi:nicotinic acid mononucleotide adenylyltransferase
VVLDRPGYSQSLPQGWMSLAVPQVDVSSTELRDALLSGRDIGDHLPPAVLHEIRARRLYQSAVLS